MTLTFKHLLYSIVLIGVITVSFTLCSKHAVYPILEKKPAFQEEIVFQKTQESRIKANVEQLLEKLLGKKTFVVTVVATLRDKDVTEQSIKYDPKIVTSNQSVTHQQVMDKKALSYMQLRPSSQTMKSGIDIDSKSAGFDFQSVATTVVDLPGFPSYQEEEKMLADEPDTRDKKNPAQAGADLTPEYSYKLDDNSESVVDQVLLNQTTVKSLLPRKQIQSLAVSVVIDQEYFSYLELNTEEVESMIVSVSGIDLEKGDTVVVSYAPFVDKAFSWGHFVRKNKVWMDKFLKVYEKVKPFLFGALVLGVLFVGYLGLKKVAMWFLNRRQRLLDEAMRKKAEEDMQTKEEKMAEIEEKKQSLVQLAQTQPEQFSMLLSSWMEVDSHVTKSK